MDAAHEVIAAAGSRAEALAGGDSEGLTELLHEDFRWTTHLGDTYDRSEYIRRNTEGHTVWRSQTLVDPRVVVVDQTAVLYAEVHDVVDTAGGASETFRMPMTQVWVRSSRTWRCLAGHAGPRLS
ncbi:nuclear transport factor 2 family protein [Nocardioides sp. Soil805]|uniref:nuclear transport factor 2 family protein n=1 Tax=Nocardioides sp. Soil805 TaxID=1736416 RepID=UPI000AA56A36|nr:nuclear transport factor 2 family protein [Nocardioides sp. Soil805]